jgi:hypothetical protein
VTATNLSCIGAGQIRRCCIDRSRVGGLFVQDLTEGRRTGRLSAWRYARTLPRLRSPGDATIALLDLTSVSLVVPAQTSGFLRLVTSAGRPTIGSIPIGEPHRDASANSFAGATDQLQVRPVTRKQRAGQWKDPAGCRIHRSKASTRRSEQCQYFEIDAFSCRTALDLRSMIERRVGGSHAH